MTKGLVYLQLYVDDLLAHVHLAGEPTFVVGARVLLWCAAARSRPVGTLPDDEAELRRLAGLSEAEWQQAWPYLRASWKYDDKRGRWVVKRIAQQAKQTRRISEARKRAGAKGGAARSRRNEDSGEPIAKQKLSTPSPSPAPSPTPSPAPEREKSGPAGAVPQDALSQGGSAPEDEEAIADVHRWYLQELQIEPRLYPLTATRREAIRARLGTYSVPELRKAITACANEPDGWHRRNGRDGLTENILRDDETVRRWLRQAEDLEAKAAPAQTHVPDYSQDPEYTQPPSPENRERLRAMTEQLSDDLSMDRSPTAVGE